MACSKVAICAATLFLGGLLLVACRTDTQGLSEPVGQLPPAQVERQDASGPTGEPIADARAPMAVDALSTPPDSSAPVADAAVGVADAVGPAPTSLGPVVRAKEIEADTVVAQVIYAKEIEAEEAKLGALIESKDDKRWEMGGADTKVAVQSLLAETIYVEKLRCRRVEARELYAEVVKIQRR